ncbi:MAG: hypothetical protein EOO24_40245 [Comamonadaceae bacterium]|nr:MAG: hypothetical protein EOO24_40245 [Comamonadaceae bacterium]
MKYLIVLFVIAVAIWLWRRNRREQEIDDRSRHRAAAPPPPGTPQQMARCAHCGLHLPAIDAIAGPGDRVYCSAAHRSADAQ